MGWKFESNSKSCLRGLNELFKLLKIYHYFSEKVKVPSDPSFSALTKKRGKKILG